MSLSPGIAFWNPNPQFFDANGVPLVGGTLTFYVAGTTTLTRCVAAGVAGYLVGLRDE